MSDKIKFKRGPKKALPEVAELGEPLYCTDTNELFVGTGDGVQMLAVVKTIDCGYFGDTVFDVNRDQHYDGGTF